MLEDIKLPLLSNFSIFFVLLWERTSPLYSSTIRWNFFLDILNVAKKVYLGRVADQFSLAKLLVTCVGWSGDSIISRILMGTFS